MIFVLEVSTIAYRVISTSSGFSSVVDIAVEASVLTISQKGDGPTKYRIISKLWKVMAVSSVLLAK